MRFFFSSFFEGSHFFQARTWFEEGIAPSPPVSMAASRGPAPHTRAGLLLPPLTSKLPAANDARLSTMAIQLQRRRQAELAGLEEARQLRADRQLGLLTALVDGRRGQLAQLHARTAELHASNSALRNKIEQIEAEQFQGATQQLQRCGRLVGAEQALHRMAADLCCDVQGQTQQQQHAHERETAELAKLRAEAATWELELRARGTALRELLAYRHSGQHVDRTRLAALRARRASMHTEFATAMDDIHSEHEVTCLKKHDEGLLEARASVCEYACESLVEALPGQLRAMGLQNIQLARDVHALGLERARRAERIAELESELVALQLQRRQRRAVLEGSCSL